MHIVVVCCYVMCFEYIFILKMTSQFDDEYLDKIRRMREERKIRSEELMASVRETVAASNRIMQESLEVMVRLELSAAKLRAHAAIMRGS